ncbi:MAG TPA: hypothetical protein VN328_07340 [Thermodesulfovibrionales bacterium]|nr:hypothetical protein [Thermodesulfovibrionales bacterium]
MKTIEKQAPISKALTEVWEWKEEVYKDIKDMSFEEKQEYYSESLKDAVKILNRKLKANPDGSCSIVK